MDEVLTVFAHEAREKLDAMEAGLMALEGGHGDGETLNAIFRAAHTIKGGAGVVEADAIERFTHVLENLLDQLREGRIAISPALTTLILAACDHLRRLLDDLPAAQAGSPAVPAAEGTALAARLQAHLRAAPAAPCCAAGADAGAADAAAGCWHVSVGFGREVLRQGMDPEAFLRQLAEVGRIRRVVGRLDAMPAPEEMDAEACYLGCEIELDGAPDQRSIEQVFEFVRDDCELQIRPPASVASASGPQPEDGRRPGGHVPGGGAAADGELAAAPARAALPVAGSKPAPAHGEDTRLIRIQADKLDRLIDLVGELVVASASTQLLARQSGQTTLTEAAAVLARLVDDVRDSALQLRMVTIGETFNRFHRVVRDTALEMGKDIVLELRGADTELDKSVVERLADPLLHMVRNAIDHGIEPTAVRLARGKPATGRLSLNACHESGHVVIEVADDGGGLDAERIRAKAVERGLIDANAVLGEGEIYKLIFEPGFSTASQVTSLSGRGVGMDVVRKTIAALRGTVEAHAAPGKGSRFVLRLPLTLAIIEGFLVGAQDACYVIPLDHVVECRELLPDETSGNVLRLRGSPLPFVRLRELFGIDGAPPRRENVVVVQAAGQRAGIVVDQLLGEFQTVIKPLGSLFRHLRGVAGSTIMASGEVALIVDVPSLIGLAARAGVGHASGVQGSARRSEVPA